MDIIAVKVILQLLSIVLSLIMIIYFLVKARKTQLLYSFIWCQSLICIWSIGQLFEMFSTIRQMLWYTYVFQYSAISFIGLSWLIFCLLYSEYDFKRKKFIIPILFIPPVVFFILMATNEYHNLFYKVFEFDSNVYGMGFWAHSFFSYCYLTTGTAALVKSSLKKYRYERKQSILLVIAVLFPLVMNILFVFRIVNLGFDTTPLSFTFSLMLFAIVSFRFKFINIMPIALRKTFDSLEESVIVVDNYNKIVDYNYQFNNIFLTHIKANNCNHIYKIFKDIEKYIEVTDESCMIIKAIESCATNQITGELKMILPIQKCLKVNIRHIYKNKTEILGRIISFNNVSEYKNLLDKVNEKNEKLKFMNEKLLYYANVVEELAVSRERNRLAKEMHDTIGSYITVDKISDIRCDGVVEYSYEWNDIWVWGKSSDGKSTGTPTHHDISYKTYCDEHANLGSDEPWIETAPIVQRGGSGTKWTRMVSNY